MNEQQQKILNGFTKALDKLETVLDQVDEDQLDWAERAGEWHIRQVLHHLTDDGNVYTFIIERALATPGCKVVFGGFPGNEAWAQRLGFNQRPITHALALLRAQRRFIAEMVSHCSDRWGNQVGFYDEAGEKLAEQSVEGMLIMLTEHMREHTRMIESILRSHNA